jgi:hypothetical protein
MKRYIYWRKAAKVKKANEEILSLMKKDAKGEDFMYAIVD